MSLTYRQTIGDDLARLVDVCRGPLSLQDFTTAALLAACVEPPVAAELRAEIDRLHTTMRAFSASVAVPVADERLSW